MKRQTGESSQPLITPDGRYLVVRGRLWRKADPGLSESARGALVAQLMAARRAVRDARKRHDDEAEKKAHAAVDAVKHALGERGPVWWSDGAPDLNRHLARKTPYASWMPPLKARLECLRSGPRPQRHDIG